MTGRSVRWVRPRFLGDPVKHLFSTTVSVTVLLAAATLAPASAGVSSESVRFEHTGDVQSFVVPPGVTQVEIEACGARGGSGGGDVPGSGGRGARVTATLSVTPGETLSILAGGSGEDGEGLKDDGAIGGAEGFNGGGQGGSVDGGNDDAISGAGGGGASDVRQGGTALADRVVVAGGGGGGGGQQADDDDSESSDGGDAGATGTDGGPGTDALEGLSLIHI